MKQLTKVELSEIKNTSIRCLKCFDFLDANEDMELVFGMMCLIVRQDFSLDLTPNAYLMNGVLRIDWIEDSRQEINERKYYKDSDSILDAINTSHTENCFKHICHFVLVCYILYVIKKDVNQYL
jgi:hypothetical protein